MADLVHPPRAPSAPAMSVVVATERFETVRALIRHLHAQTGVDRLLLLGPAEPDALWLTPLGSWGIPGSLEARLRLPARGNLVSLLASGGAAAALDRLGSVPGLGPELGILASGGFAAAAPVLSAGTLLDY